MKQLVLIFLLILSTSAYSQIESERNEYYLLSRNGKIIPNDSTKSWLNIYGAFDLNSNAVTNDFVKAMLYKGFIGDTEKDQVSKRLKSMNRFGFEFTGGLTYKYLYKKDLTLVAGLYEREFFSSKFTKDAFELTFRGNEMYAGKNADLTGVKVTYFNYQSLYLGAIKSVNPKLKIGGGLSFIRGGQYNSLKIKKGNLYTDTAGAYLDFNMDFKLQLSNGKNALSSDGAGAALNFFLMYQQERGLLTIEIRDLGLIKWNNLSTYQGNSTYRYDGIDVSNALNFSDSTFLQTRVDSIASNAGISEETKGNTFFIPATFNISYAYDYSEKLDVAAGIKYIANAGYLPRVYVKGIYNLSNSFIIVPTLAYGGFGRMDFELGAAKSFKSDWIISANAFLFEYLAFPTKTSGQGLNLSLTKLF